MQQLFSKYTDLSKEAEKLLDDITNTIQETKVPTQTICDCLSSTLSEMRKTYESIRTQISSHISANELPGIDAPISEYETTWANSIFRQQRIVREVMEEFLRVYSTEQRYMDAIEPVLEEVRLLLSTFETESITIVDVAQYSLFLEGVKGDLEDESLVCRLEDGLDKFTHRAITGLFQHKYSIREKEPTTTCDSTTIITETETITIPAEDTHDKETDSQQDTTDSETTEQHAQSDSATDRNKDNSSEKPETELISKEGTASETETNSQANNVNNTKEEPEPINQQETDVYIHPINQIKSFKIPSDQKLNDLVHMTDSILRFLLDKLSFTGMMDENHVFDVMSKQDKPISRETCIETLALLERKGFICTYEYNGRNILCFTELMKSCLQKPSTSQKLKQLLHEKKLKKPDIIGLQDMPLVEFTHHLALTDEYYSIMDRLNEDTDAIALLPTSSWIQEKGYYTVNLPRNDMPDLLLRLTNSVDFVSTVPDEDEGVFCYSECLPDMATVTDEVHYCLTADGLYQWKNNQWIAITESKAKDKEDTIAPVITEEPQQLQEETQDTTTLSPVETKETTPAEAQFPEDKPSVPSVPADIKIEITEESTDGLWLDDLNDSQEENEIPVTEFAGYTASEIATTMISNSMAGVEPKDEDLAYLIQQLLLEGVRSHEPEHLQDQVVEAVVLSKLLSANEKFPICKTLFDQLHVALPIFREPFSHSGMNLTNAFAVETDITPVAKLCAYIYGMLFPARAHDHLFATLYKAAFSEYETNFAGFDAVKPLYHKAMEGLQKVPSGFSPANLMALSDSKSQLERMQAIQEKAKAYKKPPVIKMMVHGVPELIDLCFGINSGIYTALEVVEANDTSLCSIVEEEIRNYCDEEGEIKESKLDDTLDSNWTIAAQKYSSRRMGIKYEARRLLKNAFTERINLLQNWLEESSTEATPDIEKLRAIRTDITNEIGHVEAEIHKMTSSADKHLIEAFLQLIWDKLTKQYVPGTFATLLRSGSLIVENNELILNEALNEIKYAEPWRAMLKHIACTEYNLNVTYERIRTAKPDSEDYDNFGQMKMIGKLLGKESTEYDLSADGLRDVIRSADLEAKNFREKLEISYAYNRISENDRERLVLLSDPVLSDFRSFFYDHKAFGCWRAFLNALRSQIRDVAQHSMRDVRTQLEHAKTMLKPDESCALLTEAERLITAEQNYAVAEDYIHRFRNGERNLPFETNDGTINHFLTFTSEKLFTSLFGICERSKESTLGKFGIRYIESNHPEGWTSRHMDDAHTFLLKWPNDSRSVSAQSIKDFCNMLGFNVEKSEKSANKEATCFTLSVKKAEQNLADYRHPISMFGTQMKSQIDVVCLFGKRTAKQLVDDACKLGITSTFIVLLDANLPLKDRQKMAEYFFTQKNVGQASFLVIDRVLALYLAMQSNNERLPALLQCTLPYTIYQPFTNGSGSTADEMFFGRVSELASIRDMNGASIVYGGRQLGKTALLERAKHLDNNPSKGEFAVMTSFKGCKGEEDFVKTLIRACNDAFYKHGITLDECLTIRDFSSQINKLLSDNKVATLRLLLDETDDFLESISVNSYSELIPLIDLQRSSDRRFKFVLAGLHNVCRAKNATKNNGIFGQLGHPLCIKPLTPSDARNLLVRPLRYLGFRISNESHIDTILTNTNYYPGIIQFFGYTLIQTLATQYMQYYDAAKGNPPFELHDDQLASIMNSKDLNNNIKERLRWTLEMDDRYFMLARCITVLYHLNGNDYSMISAGFDVLSIYEIAHDMFDIKCLTSLTEKEVIALLDEMEEMGILSKPTADENRYLLRRRSFIDVIGTSLDVLEHDIEAYNEENSSND